MWPRSQWAVDSDRGCRVRVLDVGAHGDGRRRLDSGFDAGQTVDAGQDAGADSGPMRVPGGGRAVIATGATSGRAGSCARPASSRDRTAWQPRTVEPDPNREALPFTILRATAFSGVRVPGFQLGSSREHRLPIPRRTIRRIPSVRAVLDGRGAHCVNGPSCGE